MKKNVMMRVASIMLVLVLMSSSVISGTFAKYVTSGESTDKARVAKFGVKVEPNGEMFLKYYEADDVNFTLADDTVVTSDDWKLIAPGTSHSMTKVHLTGKPEVAVRVSYEATNIVLGTFLDANGDEYCPIVFTINDVTYGTTVTNATNKFATIAELVAEMKNVIKNYKKDYVANTDLSTIYAMDNNALEISWEWPFETGTTPAEIAANDIKDTFLGDQAAAGYYSMIQFDITTTVTQIN